jgi:ribonuclease PH
MSQKIVKSIANSILLNEYPKSQIDIFIMVLHHDGSVLSAAINAAVVALCDSGILMKDLPMAASVLVGDSDIFLDPTASEEAVFHSKVSTIVGGNLACKSFTYLNNKTLSYTE